MDRALTLPAPRHREAGTAAAARRASLAVENMTCGSCLGRIERALLAAPGVDTARASFTAKRVSVTFDPAVTDPDQFVEVLARSGYRAAELAAGADESAAQRADDLLRRLGVAGFAAANVMLLSEVVWFGAVTDMDETTTALFHWLSALFAMPATAYAAQPFFRSAATALKARRLNMDVPISLGIVLALAMSLYQTIQGSQQVYFDAAISLTFFLLIGRYLDEKVRVRAHGAAANLLGLKALWADVVGANGEVKRLPARALQPGMRVQVPAGERIPVDGRVLRGSSEVDTSLITGESVPRPAAVGDPVHAGTLNLGSAVLVEATATDDNTLLADIARLVEAAEQGRGHYVRLADRAARLYAPAVHILGAATLLGWLVAGGGFEQSLTYAIAVLIITCPCALALAVPAVQVAAAGRLFAGGVIVKAADGLERLAEVDTVAFDKTGTLTRGEPSLANAADVDDATLAAAASLAIASRHPYSRAVVRTARERGLTFAVADDVLEKPGCGLCARTVHGERRLGSASWVGADGADVGAASLWFRQGTAAPIALRFEDSLRVDAVSVIAELRRAGYRVCLLSGDREEAARATALAVGIADWSAPMQPAGKIARLESLKAQGRKVLMVGDGLNDAPALAAAHASLSPSTAADASQTASDAVFQGERLMPVVEVLKVARAAQSMSLENFAIAIAYNVVSVPLAMAGYVTPLIAALAMSLSSIAVTVNALRLRGRRLRLPEVKA